MDLSRIFVVAALVSALTARGEATSVRASEFGWNAEDATECLRAALKSGAKTVRIDKKESDWVLSSTVRLPSDIEVVLEDGVTVRAMPDRFKGLTDSLLAVIRQKRVTLRGEGTARRTAKSFAVDTIDLSKLHGEFVSIKRDEQADRNAKQEGLL